MLSEDVKLDLRLNVTEISPLIFYRWLPDYKEAAAGLIQTMKAMPPVFVQLVLMGHLLEYQRYVLV